MWNISGCQENVKVIPTTVCCQFPPISQIFCWSHFHRLHFRSLQLLQYLLLVDILCAGRACVVLPRDGLSARHQKYWCCKSGEFTCKSSLPISWAKEDIHSTYCNDSSHADIWNLLWIRSANGACPLSLSFSIPIPPFYLKLRFECRKYICPPSPSFRLPFLSRLPPFPLRSPSRCDVTGRGVDPTFGYIKLTFGIPSEFAYGSTWKSHYGISGEFSYRVNWQKNFINGTLRLDRRVVGKDHIPKLPIQVLNIKIGNVDYDFRNRHDTC